MTTKEQSLAVLDTFIRLGTENAALKTVLSCYRLPDGSRIDWRKEVMAIVEHPETQGVAQERYAHIRQAIADHPEADDNVALVFVSMLSAETP